MSESESIFDYEDCDYFKGALNAIGELAGAQSFWPEERTEALGLLRAEIDRRIDKLKEVKK